MIRVAAAILLSLMSATAAADVKVFGPKTGWVFTMCGVPFGVGTVWEDGEVRWQISGNAGDPEMKILIPALVRGYTAEGFIFLYRDFADSVGVTCNQ
jgi:hypothetical protein